MTKSLLLTSALSILAVAATGCAHQPPAQSAALSAQLNVMQAANDLGYTVPRVVNGKTLYCQPEELTGSMVPKLACIDGDQVLAMARSQGDELKYLFKPPISASRPGGS
jgi:hypothetical protein